MFTFPEVSGQTKEDGVEFSQDQSTAEFMPAEVEGFDKEQTMLLGRDEKGVTVMRDAIWQKFSVNHILTQQFQKDPLTQILALNTKEVYINV